MRQFTAGRAMMILFVLLCNFMDYCILFSLIDTLNSFLGWTKSKQNRSFHFAMLCTVDSQNAACDSKHRSGWCRCRTKHCAEKKIWEISSLFEKSIEWIWCHTDMSSKLLCGFRSESALSARSQFAHPRMLLWISRNFSLHCSISYVLW